MLGVLVVVVILEDRVELVDDGLRQILRTDQAEPAIAVGRVAKLFQRRNVGKGQCAFGSGGRQCPEFPGIDQGLGLLARHHGVGQPAGKHFRRHLGGCRERDGDRLKARELCEQRAGDLDRAALVSVRDLVGIFLGIVDEVFDRLHRQLGVDDQDHRRDRQTRDRRDVVDRIVWQLIERRQHRLAAGQHEQIVAVGALLANALSATSPWAPGRFSTTKVWPSASERTLAATRAVVSAAPPAPVPTVILTVRDG